MAKTTDKDNEKMLDLLSKMHEQAWDLYKHEDNLSETRNSRFRTIITAFFGLAGAFATFFVSKIDSHTPLETARVILLIYALICLFLSVIILMLIINWYKVNNAAMVYTRLRFEVAEKIEDKLADYFLDKQNIIAANNTDDYYIARYERNNKREKIIGLVETKNKAIVEEDKNRKGSFISDHFVYSGGYKSTRDTIKIYLAIDSILILILILLCLACIFKLPLIDKFLSFLVVASLD